MFTGSMDASAGFTASQQSHYRSTRKIRHVSFIQCLFVPKKSFQIPAIKMRLSQDALARALHVNSHYSAGEFLNTYHAHVSTGLYHLGGIFFHELTISSEEQTTFEQLVVASDTQIKARFGLSIPLVAAVEVSGGYNSSHNSASEVNSSCQVTKFRENITTLGPSAQDARAFLLKLEEDPYSWAIIDQEGVDLADNLVSVWEILLQHPVSSLSDHDAEHLKQSARFMSECWQDEISCMPWPLPPMLPQLLHKNTALHRTTALAGGTLPAGPSTFSQLQRVSSSRIQQLPQKISLTELSMQLRRVLLSTSPETDASISTQAATLVKSCISQVKTADSESQKLLWIIMGYGFDNCGNLPKPLNPPQLRSLIHDLERNQRASEDPGLATPAASTSANYWLENKNMPSLGHFSEGIVRSNVLIKYARDVVVDRPFLMNLESTTLTQQSQRLLDCLRHRVNPIPHLSQIRGGNLASARDESWDDDDAAEGQVASPFELLIELLKISDIPTQVAVYKLLLEQRAAVPLVHPDSTPGPASFCKPVLLKHYVQALSFVEVKLPKEDKMFIAEDVKLPRVVFLSKRKISESGSATVASKALSCNFMSQYYRSDMGHLDAPVVEVGLGFVRPGQVQAGQSEPFPCLVFHITGPCDEQLMNFVYDVADVIVLELDSEKDVEMLAPPRPIELLQWHDSRVQRLDKDRKIISGGETYIVSKTEQFLRSALGKSHRQTLPSTYCKKGIKEVCSSHFTPHKLIRFEQQESKLRECNFTTAKQSLALQESFTEESKIQFELLKLKDNPAETRIKENSCQEEKKRRARLIEGVIRNPLLQLFHELISMEDATSRRVGMMWLERAIAEEMQPLMSEATYRKDTLFKDWQKNLSNVHLRERYLLANKQDYVDKVLGVGNLWRELCHIFVANPKRQRHLATLAAVHLLDAFPMEILDGDAGMFCKDWVLTVLAELETLTAQAINNRPARIFVLSVMGLQSSGKSTLLNLMFGTQLHTSAGRCTRGVYIQLVKSERPEYDYLLLLDTEGIRSPEFHGLQEAQTHDNRLATFGLLPSDASIFMVSNEDDSGLKEVLPMVLLAFKGSAIAERYGGRIHSKMVFVYRSVDTNDTRRLNENKEKLQEHLRNAAEKIADIGLNRYSGGSDEHQDDEVATVAAATGEMLRSMFSEGLRVDDDDEKSDVKCMGNLKRGHTPPDDVPEWAYGEQVVKIREYIHKRVTEEKGWAGTSLREWGDYLSMVWDSICQANFDLSFKTAVEVSAYKELQKRLAGGPRLQLSKKCMEEFEKMDVQVRSMQEGEDASVIRTAFENNVGETMNSTTAEVRRILSTSMWKQWKTQEQNKWDIFCVSLVDDYKHRIDDMVSGVLKFDNVVSDYERKMKREIVELTEAGKLGPGERYAVFENIFVRILNEAKRLHEPFAERVASSVKKAYEISDLTKMFQLHTLPPYSKAKPALSTRTNAQNAMDVTTASGGSQSGNNVLTRTLNTVLGAAMSLLPHHQLGDGSTMDVKQMQMLHKLDHIVVYQLSNVKKYDDLIVINVIEVTTRALESYTREEQQRGHRWVMNSLIDKLRLIQEEWDKKHNVAERLKAAKPQLRGFFEDRANGVGAANMLISELQRLLEAHLQASHHELLVAAVVDNYLGNRSWVINWEAMRACLDIHLLTLIECNRTEELFESVQDGSSHFRMVGSLLVMQEITRLYKVEWDVFFQKVKRSLEDAGQAARSLANPSGKGFLEELQRLLGNQRWAKLANSVVSKIYMQDQYTKELDGDFFSTKVPELCKRLEASFAEQGSALDDCSDRGESGKMVAELVKKVWERMEQLKDERVTPRCMEGCLRCGITCFRAAGHAERHDTVHQPDGLTSVIFEESSELVPTSCWKSLAAGHTFKHEGRLVPYADFEKVFASWLNPSNYDTTATQVREYIFFNYQPGLTQYFNTRYKTRDIKMCPPIKMPPSYNHSMEQLYNTLQNRLGDDFSTVAHTFKQMYT